MIELRASIAAIRETKDYFRPSFNGQNFLPALVLMFDAMVAELAISFYAVLDTQKSSWSLPVLIEKKLDSFSSDVTNTKISALRDLLSEVKDFCLRPTVRSIFASRHEVFAHMLEKSRERLKDPDLALGNVVDLLNLTDEIADFFSTFQLSIGLKVPGSFSLQKSLAEDHALALLLALKRSTTTAT